MSFLHNRLGGFIFASGLIFLGQSIPTANAVFVEAHLPIASSSSDVEVVGTTAFIIGGQAFESYDVSDPLAPNLLDDKFVSIPGDFMIDGSLAFIISSGTKKIRILDVSNPASIVSVAEVTPTIGSSQIRAVAANGNLMGVSTTHEGLRIYDITNPAVPVLMGSLYEGLSQVGPFLTIHGDVAYWPFASEIRVVDLSNPASPTVATRIDYNAAPHTNLSAGEMKIVGTNMFVASESSLATLPGGLRIYDVSTPLAPVEIGAALDGSRGGVYLALDGNDAYVAGEEFSVFDISNLTAPAHLSSMLIPSGPDELAGTGGDYVYGVAASGLLAIDVSNKSLVPIEVVAMPSLAATSETMERDGNLIFIDGPNEFDIIDVSTPTSPFLVGSYVTTNPGTSLKLDGATAYYVGAFGADTVNISNPASPAMISRWTSVDGGTSRGYKTGDVLYVTTEFGNAHLLDVSDPANIFKISNSPVNGNSFLGGDETNVFVHLGDKLRWFDTSVPAAPVQLNDISPGNRMTIIGSRGYVGDTGFGMRIFDLSSPPTAVELSNVRALGGGKVDVVGGFAYIPGGGVSVVDIQDEANPVFRGGFKVPGVVRAVNVIGNYAFVGSSLGFYVYDLGPELSSATGPSVPTIGSLGIMIGLAIIMATGVILLRSRRPVLRGK